jgi:hypothetical protein
MLAIVHEVAFHSVSCEITPIPFLPFLAKEDGIKWLPDRNIDLGELGGTEDLQG